jgi:hypothetical protein
MPHDLFLRSSLVRKNSEEEKRFALLSTAGDSLIALNASWLINAAILIIAATVFFKNGQTVLSIEQAHFTLLPLLGQLAAGAFALGLLVALECLHRRPLLWPGKLFLKISGVTDQTFFAPHYHPRARPCHTRDGI